jgi:hypothetical protein
VPWLGQVSPGRIEPGLRRFAGARLPWLARDIVEAIDTTNRRMSWSSPAAGQVRNPHALLAHYLRGFDVDADHPRLYLDPYADRTPPPSRVQQANTQRRDRHEAAAVAVAPPAEFRDAIAELRARNRGPGPGTPNSG